MRGPVSLVAVGIVALALSACGSAARHPARTTSTSSQSPTTSSSVPAPATHRRPAIPVPLPPSAGIPSPGPTHVPAPASALAVIRGWADTLRRGDVAGAARFFALPSVLVNGTDSAGQSSVAHIFSYRDAVAANTSLSCGAVLLSADVRGRYVNALFRLTDRTGPGGGCGAGVGQTARTNFLIADGRIVEWLRAPDDPGDSPGALGVPSRPTPAQQSGSPVV